MAVAGGGIPAIGGVGYEGGIDAPFHRAGVLVRYFCLDAIVIPREDASFVDILHAFPIVHLSACLFAESYWAGIPAGRCGTLLTSRWTKNRSIDFASFQDL